MPAQAVQLFPMKNSDNVRRDEMFESLNNKSDQIIQVHPTKACFVS